MANSRENPNDVRDIESDERGRANPDREDIVGKADEGDSDADAEEFEDADEEDDEEDLEA